uniref:Transcription repressor n=1 Tax=Kalanchoe fedtschenkoi TaxID=63787 RepID=A0A7N0UNT0_KALFE
MSRRKLHLNKVTVSLSCSCMKPKLSNIFDPKPRSSSATKPNTNKQQPASKDYSAAHAEAATSYYYESPNMKSPTSVGVRFGRMGGDGLAVEKDSDDPYLDFRQSMLQMIMENEIYSKDDLRELLNCFLQLNEPYYHGIIIRAFTEIWNGVFSLRPAAASSPSVKRVRRKSHRQADV